MWSVLGCGLARASAARAYVELSDQSSVLPLPINIETEALLEDPGVELSDQFTVPPQPNNIKTSARVGQVDVEVKLQNSVPSPIDVFIFNEGVLCNENCIAKRHNYKKKDSLIKNRIIGPQSINIETSNGIGQASVEVSPQKSVPSHPNNIETSDGVGQISERQQDLCSHFARIYDSPEAIEQLALMLSPIDSEDARQDLNKCEFYDRDRYNKAAKLFFLLPSFKKMSVSIEVIKLLRNSTPKKLIIREIDYCLVSGNYTYCHLN